MNLWGSTNLPMPVSAREQPPSGANDMKACEERGRLQRWSLSPNLDVHYLLKRGACGNMQRFVSVREFDHEVIRRGLRDRKSCDEQAHRAHIRQTVLSMNLHVLPATPYEVALLKKAGILGYRAPSASLLAAPDMIRLLTQLGDFRTVTSAMTRDLFTSPATPSASLTSAVQGLTLLSTSPPLRAYASAAAPVHTGLPTMPAPITPMIGSLFLLPLLPIDRAGCNLTPTPTPGIVVSEFTHPAPPALPPPPPPPPPPPSLPVVDPGVYRLVATPAPKVGPARLYPSLPPPAVCPRNIPVFASTGRSLLVPVTSRLSPTATAVNVSPLSRSTSSARPPSVFLSAAAASTPSAFSSGLNLLRLATCVA